MIKRLVSSRLVIDPCVYPVKVFSLPFSGQDIMLPIARAARSFWLVGQSTIDHWQNVTANPWHYSHHFEPGKRKRSESSIAPWLFQFVPRCDLQPESLASFNTAKVCLYRRGEIRAFHSRNTRERFVYIFSENFDSVSCAYLRTVSLFLFSLSCSLFRNLVNSSRQRGRNLWNTFEVARRFSSKVSRRCTFIHTWTSDITNVRLYRFANVTGRE